MRIVKETLSGAVVNGQWISETNREPYGYAQIVQLNGAKLDEVIKFIKDELDLHDCEINAYHIHVAEGVSL